jgi:hypothetical protein
MRTSSATNALECPGRSRDEREQAQSHRGCGEHEKIRGAPGPWRVDGRGEQPGERDARRIPGRARHHRGRRMGGLALTS